MVMIRWRGPVDGAQRQDPALVQRVGLLPGGCDATAASRELVSGPPSLDGMRRPHALPRTRGWFLSYPKGWGGEATR
jgi:hypothetical protein